MELELELDLSLSIRNPITGSNLNRNGFLSKPLLGFDPWSSILHKKRSFEDAFTNNNNDKLKDSSQTLPLLLWSGQPNDDDDDNHHRKKKPLSCLLNNGGVAMEEEVQVVGWPPIKSWRKKVLHHHHHQHQQQQQEGGRFVKNRVAANRAMESNNKNKNNGRSNSMYVKVKMEGVAIARKIDLKLFHSYQTLRDFLISMFPKCQQVEDSTDYTLTYQDKDGDWLLAGDVPWQTFMESVQRLELQRSGS